MLIVFFHAKGEDHKEFVPQIESGNATYYVSAPEIKERGHQHSKGYRC